MTTRRILASFLLVGLPLATGCQGNRQTLHSGNQRHGFFARLFGKKDHEEPKPNTACVPQDPGYASMYMEGPSLMGAPSCNTGTILPGSALPCAPGTGGAISPIAPNTGAPNPSRTVPYANPIPASPTKLSPTID